LAAFFDLLIGLAHQVGFQNIQESKSAKNGRQFAAKRLTLVNQQKAGEVWEHGPSVRATVTIQDIHNLSGNLSWLLHRWCLDTKDVGPTIELVAIVPASRVLPAPSHPQKQTTRTQAGRRIWWVVEDPTLQ
jgi:hypothetical protein